MTQSLGLYTIHDVTQMTGVEESNIRFMEALFCDYFEFRGRAFSSRHYTERHVSVLRKIHELMNHDHMPAVLVRAELERFVAARKNELEIVAVTSGKGGAGKTTVAANLAVAAARIGRKTILFDADLGLANVHILMGVTPPGTIMDVITGEATLDQILTDGPENVKVICGGSGEPDLANLDERMTTYLGRELKQLASRFDTIIIDTAAGIARNVLHFVGTADQVVIVVTPNIASILDAYGMIKVTRDMNAQCRIRILVNQAENVPEAVSVYNNITTCSQRFLKYNPNYLGYVLKDPNAELAYRTRKPMIVSYPESENAKLFGQIAGKLFARAETLEPPGPREKDLAALFFGGALSPGVFG